MDVNDYINRAAERSGYKREYFLEKNIPTTPSNLLALPFYGDLRSTSLLSSLILKTYKEKNRDKYIIMCSWPGFRDLFPYVDEFWSIDDESLTKSLAIEANSFYNTSNLAIELTRGLVEVLNVFTSKDIKKYYENGFTKDYWSTFGKINRFLPEVPSANKISNDFKLQMEHREGRKIIVYPAAKMRSRQLGKTVTLPVQKEFWSALIERLIADGYVPVIYQNWFTYDVSRDFGSKCIYLTSKSVSDILAAFRYVGCVLDIHSGISRLAVAARCPYLSVMERQIFFEDKDYEIDDICGQNLPRKYIFGFSTQLMVGGPNDWKMSLLDNVSVKLKEFLPSLINSSLPSTNESYQEVPYDLVRKINAKRIGAAFIKSSKSW